MKADDIFKGLKKDANGKFVKPEKPWFGKKKDEKPPMKYRAVPQTLNLHVGKIMPKDERINFVDPKTAELPIKIVPRLKVIIEAMSSSTKKPMRPLFTYAIVAVIAAIALTIVYTQVIAKAADADRQFLLDWQAQCVASNMTNCTPPPSISTSGAAGGGLFEFELINPLQPPGSFG